MGMVVGFALVALYIAFFLIFTAFFPQIILELQTIRRRKTLFNQTPALKKLHEFAAMKQIRLMRGKGWGAGLRIYSFTFSNVITVGEHITRARERKGMEEAAFAHELGHVKLFAERNRFCCLRKGFHCVIEEELEAWREGLIILKDLGIRVNEREYWKFAAFSLMTHIIMFSRAKCDEVFKERCPLNPSIYLSEAGPFLEHLFRNKDEPSVLRILENGYARYEAEEAIIQQALPYD